MILAHILFFEFFSGAIGEDAVAVAPAAATAAGRSRHRGFLRRGPRLPWEEEDAVDEKPAAADAVIVAKPRQRRIKLPALQIAAVKDDIPIRMVYEIEAPSITVPDLGTAVLRLDEDDDMILISI